MGYDITFLSMSTEFTPSFSRQDDVLDDPSVLGNGVTGQVKAEPHRLYRLRHLQERWVWELGLRYGGSVYSKSGEKIFTKSPYAGEA